MHTDQKPSFFKPFLLCIALIVDTSLVLHYQITYGFLSIVTCFVLLQLFLHEVYSKTLERVIGPAIAALLTAAALYLLSPVPILAIVLGLMITYLCFYIYSQQQLSYGMILGGVTSAFMVVSFYVDSLHAAFMLGFYWVFCIIIAAIIVLVVSFLAQKTGHVKSEPPTAVRKLWPIKIKFNLVSALIALRITCAILAIMLIIHCFNQESIAVQAAIAGMVVSAQMALKHSHHRIFSRVIGVVIGSIVAIILGHIINLHPSAFLTGALIVISITLISIISLYLPQYMEYSLLQAGVMIPLILVDYTPHEFYNVHIAIERSLGSIEGGFIALIVVYLFHYPIKKVLESQAQTNS